MCLSTKSNIYIRDSVKGGKNGEKIGNELTCIEEKCQNVSALLVG